MRTADTREIQALLAEPFAPEEVKFKPGVVSGSRALAFAYVNARAIQDRLDEVLGIDGWQDHYEVLPDKTVVCKLSIRLGEEWLTKEDLGDESEQPDSGDRMKAAFSGALKRAASKWGIGRYLYRLPVQWCEYDPQKRQFLKQPALPSWAVPRQRTAPAKQANAVATKVEDASNGKPANLGEFTVRVLDFQSRLVKLKLCREGQLVTHLHSFGVAVNLPPDFSRWPEQGLENYQKEVKSFESLAKKQQLPPLPCESDEDGVVLMTWLANREERLARDSIKFDSLTPLREAASKAVKLSEEQLVQSKGPVLRQALTAALWEECRLRTR